MNNRNTPAEMPPSADPLVPPVEGEGSHEQGARTEYRRVAVIGAGAWGTALANVARRAGLEVVLWAREAEVVAGIAARGVNELFLPGVPLDPAIRATGDLVQAVAGADLVLMVVPTQHLRSVAGAVAPHLAAGTPIVDCAKGIEIATGLFPSEILCEALPGHPIAALSGPTFAAEVARGQPTAITLAAPDLALARALAQAIGLPTFRPYASDDLPGVEVGGAIKNVLAIACGIVEGRGLGENARAALITRGLAEIVRLGRAKGGRAETAMGLAGLGDLVLTCSSTASRNYSLGKAIGQGQRLDDIQQARRSIAEGVPTAKALAALADRLGIELPIAAAVDAILHRDAAIDATIAALLARPFRDEAET
jgi:glycerol-3-phosphate dehydrogenase (NAD(P)+)